jgi:hypothetical protein
VATDRDETRWLRGGITILESLQLVNALDWSITHPFNGTPLVRQILSTP